MNADFSLRLVQIQQQLLASQIKQVGLWFENAADFALALLACLAANVSVRLPPNRLAENQQWLETHCDLILDDENLADYGCLQKVGEMPPLSSLIDKQNGTEIWLKTSGSSGNAKIIQKTAQQMWREAATLAKVLPFSATPQTHLLGSVSVQHLYGLTFRIFLALEMAWQLGREQLQYPEYLLAASRRAPQAIWVSSPALLSRLNLDNPEFRQANIAGIISSGGTLPEAVGNALRHTLKIPVVEIYGSTETGAIAWRTDNGLWQPLPEVEIGCNEQGALWVNSPWIDKKEQTADAVELFTNGFRLLGRIDRIVKLGDKRISLAAIEQDLLQHPWVKDCYIGLHPTQPRPVAWVALTEQGFSQPRAVLIQALKRFLAKKQEKLALPRFWRFCQALPRNSQSKISRADFERICLQTEEKE